MPLGPNFKFGTIMFIVFFAVSAVGLYGGAQLVKEDEPAAAANGGDGGGAVPPGPVRVEIAAQSIKFDKSEIVANAGEEVTVVFDNRDAGVLHNIAFYTNRNASQSIYVGDTFAGPAVQEEVFTAPGVAGEYFFRCDVHPDTMTGDFIVQ